jgi:ABC-type multidrug transport system ATPase subunit
MIRAEHLTKRYGTYTAVSDISFHVRQGEVFAFLGPNGSGKTTTLKSLVGLVVPSEGRVLAAGIDVHRFPKEARRLVSYLPQRLAFTDHQTAHEVVRFYCRLRRVPESRASLVLERAGLVPFANKVVNEFSGGMIQRLGLAVASLPDAPVLLLDEPTANLDPHGVKRFREFVLEQKENGKTIIFSTHLLAEVEQLADRVGIFVGGKLAAEASIETLRQAFAASRTIEDMYLHFVGEHED